MHHKTEYIRLPISAVAEFLQLYANYSEQKQLDLPAAKLPDQLSINNYYAYPILDKTI
jgi:hypothetical protein